MLPAHEAGNVPAIRADRRVIALRTERRANAVPLFPIREVLALQVVRRFAIRVAKNGSARPAVRNQI